MWYGGHIGKDTLTLTLLQPFSLFLQEFPGVPAAGLDLLNRLLTYDPARRLTARAAARHPYLTSEAPLPRRPADMPTFPSAHDLDARGWHARRRAQPLHSPHFTCMRLLPLYVLRSVLRAVLISGEAVPGRLCRRLCMCEVRTDAQGGHGLQGGGRGRSGRGRRWRPRCSARRRQRVW